MFVSLSTVFDVDDFSVTCVNYQAICADGTFLPYIHKACHENKVQIKVTGSRRLENGLVVPGAFLARTTSRAIATKFEEEITRLKELCSHMDITVEKLRRRPLFL